MSRTIPALLAIAIATLGLAACETRPPGHYETTDRTTRSNGTNVTTEKETDVYYDENGIKRSRTTTTETRDPEGLFNKSKTVRTDSGH